MHIIHIERDNLEAFRDYLPDKLVSSIVTENCTILGALGENDNRVAGILIYSAAEDEGELNWLFVNSDFRRQQFASKLIDMAINEMIQIDGMVRCTAEFAPDKSEGMEAFLDDHDFDMEDAEIPSYEICVNDLKMPEGLKDMKAVDDILNIKTLPLDMKNSFARSIQDTYTLAAVKVPLEWRMFDQDLSIVAVDDQKVHGAFLVDAAEDKLELVYGFSSPEKPVSFLELLNAFAKRVEGKYGRDKKVLVSAVTEEADSLVRKLAPDVKKIRVRRGTLSLYG